jgi:argininosuccinate lyase
VYLENKSREQIQQFELISQELTKTDHAFRQGNEQLQVIHESEIARETELVQQREKTLKAEVSMLRSKLGILETELLQCKNKMKKVLTDIHLEQRNFSQKHENHQVFEKKLTGDIDKIQADIDYVIHSSER